MFQVQVQVHLTVLRGGFQNQMALLGAVGAADLPTGWVVASASASASVETDAMKLGLMLILYLCYPYAPVRQDGTSNAVASVQILKIKLRLEEQIKQCGHQFKWSDHHNSR